MEFLPEKISQYSESHTSPESDILSRLNRETWSKMLVPRMLSGHLQGRVLSLLSYMVNPDCILEIGTFTGYSALCLSEGLKTNGKVITIDINEEFEDIIHRYVKEAGAENKIELIIGNALEIIPELNEVFDLVFIDADKENYSNYFDLVIDKVRKGGFIIADNVLWSGKVLDEKTDSETQAIKDYNVKILNDSRVENVLFPIRDGLMICRKK